MATGNEVEWRLEEDERRRQLRVRGACEAEPRRPNAFPRRGIALSHAERERGRSEGGGGNSGVVVAMIRSDKALMAFSHSGKNPVPYRPRVGFHSKVGSNRSPSSGRLLVACSPARYTRMRGVLVFESGISSSEEGLRANYMTREHDRCLVPEHQG